MADYLLKKVLNRTRSGGVNWCLF